MNDLISRQAAIDLLKSWSGGFDYIETKTEAAIKDFQQLPPAPSERKKGKWYIDAEGDVKCTACKTKCLRDDIGINILSNFCPNCGAKMKGEANE